MYTCMLHKLSINLSLLSYTHAHVHMPGNNITRILQLILLVSSGLLDVAQNNSKAAEIVVNSKIMLKLLMHG